MVILNVITTRGGFRVEEAASSSEYTHGGTSVCENQQAWSNVEIYNCTNSVMIIENNSFVGIIERLDFKDTVGELRVNYMTVEIENKNLLPCEKITEEKKFIFLDNVNPNVLEDFQAKTHELVTLTSRISAFKQVQLGKVYNSHA
jgi:hypothetical protein